MEIWDHLEELRSRILRSLGYALLAGIIAWYWFYDPLTDALKTPLVRVMNARHIQGGLIYLGFTEPFFLKLKVCTLLALAIASPGILWEIWGFVSPGLHPHERKPFKVVFPMVVSLFALGAGLSFVIMPMAFAWFLSYLPPGIHLQQRYPDYLLFVVKMCGAFGLGFELPVVLMFSGKIGLLSSRTMKRYWRQAVVVVMTVAAILTPSNDPLSMMMMATPMVFLYLGSIFLVKWVEPKNAIVAYGDDEEEAPEEPRTPPPHPAPVDVNEED